jgi:isocitrate dehydrogenase kinase/phosphatase
MSHAEIAETILRGFDKHYRIFREVSARAKERWERREWKEAREEGRERIDMYDQRVREAVGDLSRRFPALSHDLPLLARVKAAYIALLYEHKQPECAETFFNSVMTRVLSARYHQNDYIFSRPAISTEHLDGLEPTYRSYYPETADLRATFLDVIQSFELRKHFHDLARDLDHLMRAIDEQFSRGWEKHPNFQVQVLRSLFFRGKAAYVVGRVLNGQSVFPFVVPLLQDARGEVYVDAVLLDPRSIGRLFSVTHVYFMVEMDVPAAYVSFLETVAPGKPRSELYTMLGLQKQGKTLFFRDLHHHLRHSTDRFVLAPGTKGMVMIVFSLPSFPYVFKVIRDWFAPPKDADRRMVEAQYRFVKHHDRAGRMADTLEFTNVAFPLARFDPVLLEEIARIAPSGFSLEGDRIVAKHVYIERRVVPLDVYLAGADDGRMREAIREYGQCVKDLAWADVFPGDLLLKNFGVTRYGRVLFYDYDEVCPLTSCRFRPLPHASFHGDEDQGGGEAWFGVGKDDVFPEQLPQFLFAPGRPREIFLEEHGDLATPRWWTAQQDRIRAGRESEMFPYPPELRFVSRWR